MAKPLPLLVGVLGIGATATGGVILMSRKGSGEGTGTSSSVNGATAEGTEGNPSGRTSGTTGSTGQSAGGGQSPSTQDLIFDGIEKFKKDGPSNSDCLKNDFQGLDFSAAGAQEFGTNKPETTKFFKNATDATKATKSCLIINWKKSKGDANKWNGKFTWLWTFQRDGEGFITFNVMEPGTTDGKAKFTGVFYLVEKNGTNQKWDLKFKKEAMTATEDIDKGKLDEYFPKAGTALKSTPHNQKDYWGLIDSKEKLDEICKDESACNNQTEVKKLHWTAATSGQQNNAKLLKEWSADLTWWEKIYNIKNHWDLGDKIKNFKGTWTAATVGQ